MSSNEDLQNITHRLDNKDIQDKLEEQSNEIQSLKRELNEVKENNEMVKTQLRLLVANFDSIWPLQLKHFANSGNVVPVVIKLKEFEKYKSAQHVDFPGFYTRDGGYKMFLRIYPKGQTYHENYISVYVYLMKGDHDDHLAWPVKGTLTVQLLNQLSNSDHSDAVMFHFNGSNVECKKVSTGTKSSYGVYQHKFIPYDRLFNHAIKKCQYLMDDCVIFKVCNFQ